MRVPRASDRSDAVGFRFSKRITLAPGLRMNLSPSGASWSVGPRGASMTFGKRGTYANVGLPGTGLSYRTRLDGGVRGTGRSASSGPTASQLREAERAQRAAALAEQVVEAQIRITDTGEVEVLSPDGLPLSGKAKSMFWEQRGEEVRQCILGHIATLEGETQAVADVHLETPAPVFCARFEPDPFGEPAPTPPILATAPPEPTLRLPPELGFLQRLTSTARAEHDRARASAKQQHDHAMMQWRAAVEQQSRAHHTAMSAYRQALDAWNNKKAAHDREQAFVAANFEKLVCTHVGFMGQAFDDVLSALQWPRETLISYQIEDDGAALSIDIDLPEIDDLPAAQATLSANGRRLLFKRLPKGDIDRAYAKHVHGIVLKVTGCAFATLPSLDRVMVSGYTQRVDARGVTSDVYVLSARITREQFKRMDFDHLDRINPVQVFDQYDTRRRFSGAAMQPIEPFSVGS